MRRLAFLCFFLTALALAVILGRTLGFSSRQISVVPPRTSPFFSREISGHLAQAVRIPTVSFQDGDAAKNRAFIRLRNLFKELFPLVHEKLEREIVNRYSLLFVWRGRNPKRKPVLLLGHMDVVPVEKGSEKEWAYPPFSGAIEDGYIWGRGTLDDKASVLAILEAVETLLKENFQPKRTIYLAFGHDEEINGQQGAAKIAELLARRNVDPEFILDEGTAIVEEALPGIERPIALVGVAEKGYLSVELSVKTKGGHSSVPPSETAIGILSAAIERLEKKPMPAHLQGVVYDMLAFIGPEMSFPLRLVLANLWLFGSVVKKSLSRMEGASALVRTTTAATMFHAGVKENVLPQTAKAVVNFRIHPGDSIKTVLEHVKEVIDDPRVSIFPELHSAREPSKISPVSSFGFEVIERTIHQLFPRAVVAPALVVGGTDARNYEQLSENIYRFLPIKVTADDLSRFHGTNERVSTIAYDQMARFYYLLIKNSQGEEETKR